MSSPDTLAKLAARLQHYADMSDAFGPTEEDVEVIETVTEKLAPKRTVLDPSIARAKLLLAEMESETL